MIQTINETSFKFPNQKSVYKGKVREVYNIDNRYLVMIASECEASARYGCEAKLRYLWTILGAYFLESKELYDERYDKLLKPNS